MYSLILFLPLLGTISAGGGGRFLGYRGSALVTTGCVSLCTLFTLVTFYEVALCGSTCSLEYGQWFPEEIFDPQWGFYFDTLTVVMLIAVTLVSTLVHIYSISYMWQDPHLPRFMAYLSFFTFCMVMLVTSDNFLQMFFGWEGVGVSSYLLINFWFTRLQANKSSIKAMVINRIGDFGLALGILCVFQTFKTVNFAAVFGCVTQELPLLIFLNREWPAGECIGFLLFVGALGKSAQLFLHTWLPDAMEGPTPVSALIHAATMVTAGVFLLARCSPLYELTSNGLLFVALLGGVTCFFAATTGVAQNDCKRVVAYSTCSQLGYMVFACGISQYGCAIFHLVNHAFFKALLFLGAGSVIHGLANEQDMRKMGGVAQLMPFTYALMVVGSLSLMGLPFLTGFFSKDLILELAAATYTFQGEFVWFLGSFSVLCTAYYSSRLLFLTFLGNNNSSKGLAQAAHDPDWVLALPLVVLAFASIFFGFLSRDMMVGLGTNFWGNAIFIQGTNTQQLESQFLQDSLRLLPFWLTLLGVFVAYLFHLWTRGTFLGAQMKSFKIFRLLYTFSNKRWFFDLFYNELAKRIMAFGYHVTLKTLDKGSFEILGPWGISQLVSQVSERLKGLETGMIYHYAIVILLGVTFLLSTLIFTNFLFFVVDPRLSFLLCTLIAFNTHFL